MNLPDTCTEFSTTITQLYGQYGRLWLESLPKRVALCAEQWHLSELSVSQHLSYNYVVMAVRDTDNAPVVIKLGYDAATFRYEQTALELYNGAGCVRLLAHDAQQQALLLEQLIPARPLSSLFPHHENAAIEQLVRIMSALHAVPLPNTTPLPTIADWLSILAYNCQEIPVYHVHKARELARHLLASQQKPVLLHGDLHQGNILSDHATWRSIDPKGVMGEPAYEVGTFIRNPTQLLIEHEHAQTIITNRINLFAKLMRIDRQRIKDWSYVQAVLAAFWQEQDGLDSEDMIRAAELIDQA